MNTTANPSQAILNQLSGIQSLLNTITTTISNNNQNDSEINAKVLEQISNRIETVIKKDPYIRANAILSTLLADHVGKELAESFANCLDLCRVRGNYIHLNGYYYKVKHSEQLRNLLLMCSALYRLKFTPGTNESSLKSSIKYAMMCPHCGNIAKEIKDRFDKIEVALA